MLFHPYTIGFISRCVNIVVVAVVAGVSWAILIGLALALNALKSFLLEYSFVAAHAINLLFWIGVGTLAFYAIAIGVITLAFIFNPSSAIRHECADPDKFSDATPSLNPMPLLRDIPLALFCGTIWIFALWMAAYPTEEAVGVIALAYIALWVARLAVVRLTTLLFAKLRARALRTADKLGIELPNEVKLADINGIALAVACGLIAATVASISGLSLIAILPIIPAVGLTPLGSVFVIVGWVAFAGGTLALAAFFVSSFALYARAEALADSARSGSQPTSRRAVGSVGAQPLSDKVAARFSCIRSSELALRRLSA